MMRSSSTSGLCVIHCATPAGQRGFSMIEVLIALVVLAVGLLGLALLQTTNLRYTKSANLRTQAVNLGAEILDTMRANHTEVGAYAAGIQQSQFDAAVITDAGDGNACGTTPVLTSAANITRLKCEVVEALGPEAWASVAVAGNQVTVVVTWDDEIWTTSKTLGSGRIQLVSQL